MKWQGRRKSENLDDRRGMSSGGKTSVGGGIIGIIILMLNVLRYPVNSRAWRATIQFVAREKYFS